VETLSIKRDRWLSWFLKGILILGFLIILGRLIELQLIKGSYFRKLAEGNRIRRVPIQAPRGRILARGGEVLVGNLEVKKRIIFDPKMGYSKLKDIKGVPPDEILTEWKRNYMLGSDLAHVSGYLGEVGEKEVDKVNPKCLGKGSRNLGSLIGRTGLEEMYDCTLIGIEGEELVEVDSQGVKVRTLGRREPIPGSDIKTTIHYGLQKHLAGLMQDLKGAVVVSDANGEILALYSSPSYDPNIFVDGENEKIEKVLNDSEMPLFNRALGGGFHPGSVFKPFVAVAALEESAIDESFIYDDPGVISIQTPYGDFSYTNWYFTQYGGREGEIDLVRAITRSTDTFFYKIGELTGVDNLVIWATKFGLGEASGIDIPGEIAGLIPSPDWKEKVRGERWFLGNTYHMSIGQGDIALTPIGVNTAIAAIAANGNYCSPHIIANEESGNFQCRDLDISEETVNLVKEGMRGACSSGGTGYTFFDFSIPIACKTGTAETNEEDKTHAWFTAFAPIEFPEVVATVLVEKGGEGAYVAGPIAREIFDYWFIENNND
jgi:penicillin-binding protein 2